MFTSDSTGGSPPASRSKIFQFGFSLNRPATAEPAEPDPTIMKSYSSIPNNKKKVNDHDNELKHSQVR